MSSRPSSVSDGTGSRVYHYDDLDGITSVDTYFGTPTGTLGPYTVGYQFYPDGQPS